MAKKEASTYPAKKRRLVQELDDGKFCAAYLVFGEEDYLRAQDTRYLLERLGARDGDMNFTRFSGKGVGAAEIIETAETMPFFADRRVILVEDSGFFAARKRGAAQEGADEEAGAGGEDGKRLAAYLKEPASAAHIVFSESEVNRTTALYKAIDKMGFALSCDPPSEADLKRWVAKRFKDGGIRIEEQAADRLLSLTAGGASNEPRIDMNMLSREMEKLASYCLGRDVVRLADVEAVCSDSLTDSVFAMVERMAKGDRSGAAALYQDMLGMKHAPLMILSLISRQFNNILQVAELTEARLSQQEIAARLSLHPFVVRLCAGWGRSYSRGRLLEILSYCAESETAIKRGRMADTVAVESVIVACSGG